MLGNKIGEVFEYVFERILMVMESQIVYRIGLAFEKERLLYGLFVR